MSGQKSGRYEVGMDELGCWARQSNETWACVMHFTQDSESLQERIAEKVIRQQARDIAEMRAELATQEIGAAGPENAEDSARRACGVIQRQADQIVSADTRIAALESALAVRDTEIARLQTDLELVRRDADRYRWLRANATQRLAVELFGQPSPTYIDSRIDAALPHDAARAGNGGDL